MRPASAHAYCYSHAFADAHANGHTSTNAYSYLHTMAGNRCTYLHASVDPNVLSDAPSTTQHANANPTNPNTPTSSS